MEKKRTGSFESVLWRLKLFFSGLFVDEFAVGLEVEDLDFLLALPEEETALLGDAGLVGHFIAGFAYPEVGDVEAGVGVFDIVDDGFGVVVAAFDDVVGLHAFIGENHGLARLLLVEVGHLEGVLVDLPPGDVGGVGHLALEIFDVVDFHVLFVDGLLCEKGSGGEEKECCNECYFLHGDTYFFN